MKPISSHRATPKPWPTGVRLHEPDIKTQRYRAPDSLIDFLKTL
ncbi:MAG: hypothetical protein WC710_12890 [Gallionella sp.]